MPLTFVLFCGEHAKGKKKSTLISGLRKLIELGTWLYFLDTQSPLTARHKMYKDLKELQAATSLHKQLGEKSSLTCHARMSTAVEVWTKPARAHSTEPEISCQEVGETSQGGAADLWDREIWEMSTMCKGTEVWDSLMLKNEVQEKETLSVTLYLVGSTEEPRSRTS